METTYFGVALAYPPPFGGFGFALGFVLHRGAARRLERTPQKRTASLTTARSQRARLVALWSFALSVPLPKNGIKSAIF